MANLFSKRLWNKDFILILLVCSVASFTNGVFMNLLPVYVLDLGGSNADTGMMMTGLTILGMVTRLVIAPLIDRVGRKPLLVLGSGLYFLNALAFCFTDDLTVIFVLRVLHGFTQGVFFPVPPTMVADCTPEDLLVDGMGFFGISSSVMFAVTPTIGLTIYENLGAKALFTAAAFAGLVSFLLTLPVKEHYRRPAAAPQKGKAAKPAFRLDGAFLLLILAPAMMNFFLGMGGSCFNNFLTPCGLSRGIQQIGLFFLVNHFVAMAARLFVGQTLRFVSRRFCIVAGLILCGAGYALLGFSYSMTPVVISAAIIGVGGAYASQLMQVQVMTSVTEERRGIANSAYMLMGDLGNGAGSAAWGAVSANAGYTLAFVLSGVAVIVGCGFELFPKKNRKEVTV